MFRFIRSKTAKTAVGPGRGVELYELNGSVVKEWAFVFPRGQLRYRCTLLQHTGQSP
jgi:hypothetical protein